MEDVSCEDRGSRGGIEGEGRSEMEILGCELVGGAHSELMMDGDL